jgi:hypothetical protein
LDQSSIPPALKFNAKHSNLGKQTDPEPTLNWIQCFLVYILDFRLMEIIKKIYSVKRKFGVVLASKQTNVLDYPMSGGIAIWNTLRVTRVKIWLRLY